MGKTIKVYTCSKCGAQSPKWSGRCLECGKWGGLIEDIRDFQSAKKIENNDVAAAEIIDLKELKIEQAERLVVGIKEFDRVAGGGILPGSLTLLAGEPGVGKSTILAQIADSISRQGGSVVYASGEESASQVKNRFERLACHLDNIKFVSEINVEKIAAAIKQEKPKLAIIDSIQTVYSSSNPSEAGNISQIRACAVLFLELSKANNIPIILVGHITKDGAVAGPKTLEHIVDSVMYLETDVSQSFRLLRSSKNRFGSTNELGIFEMSSAGFKEIKNPSSVFLDSAHANMSGSVISCVIEGKRAFMVEIQALVSKTIFGYPQRKASGFDSNRLQVLTTVITKKTKYNLVNQDVILNSVGGVKINDTALDLAVCLAIMLSIIDKIYDNKTLVLGEVGLGGEVRNVPNLDSRLKEAEKLGFKKAVIPDVKVSKCGLILKKIKNINELV